MTLRPVFAVLTAVVLAFAAPAQDLRARVLLIGMDGCRPDAMQAAATPNLDALTQNGTVSLLAQTGDITSSGPGWSSLLCGVWRNKHGVNNNSFSGNNYARYPHFFRRVRQSCSTAYLASIVNWAPIDTHIVVDADFRRAGIPDAQVAQQAAQLLASGDPDVLFLHFDDIDHAGHAYGYSPTVPNYLSAIQGVDGHIGTVLSAMRARAGFAQENWLVLVTSDHGGVGTSHGGNTPAERTIPVIVSGPSASRLAFPTPPTIVDLVPTLFTFLNLPIDPAWGWDGQPVGLSAVPTTPPTRFPCLSCPRALTARPNHVLGQVRLSWDPRVPGDATGLRIARNGQVVASLPVGTADWTDTAPIGAESGHVELRYELQVVGGSLSAQCQVSSARTWLSAGDVRLFEDFDGFVDDLALELAGWRRVNVNQPVEQATWTVTNPAGRNPPPGPDGTATAGRFVISDSDWGGSSSLQNPPGSGMSFDLRSPSFDCSGMAEVWLHIDCSAVLNNNGQAVFDVDVSTDGGWAWNNALRRVAPARTGHAPAVSTGNADGFFGRMHVELTPWAANRPDVRFRLRHFEPNWDWWIAVDNALVDNVDVQRGGDVDVLPPQDFAAGIPAGFSVRGLRSGTDTWTTADPCARSIASTGASFPYLGGRAVHRLGTAFAILDSDCGAHAAEDEYLITPTLDCSAFRDVFLHYASEIVIAAGAVEEVLLSLDGGQTFRAPPLFSYAGGGLAIGEEPAFASRVLAVPEAAGQVNVAFAFRYQSGGGAWWWALDDVGVSGSTGVRAAVWAVGQGCGQAVPPPTVAVTTPVLGGTAVFTGSGAPAGVLGFLAFSSVPPAPTPLGGACTAYLNMAELGRWWASTLPTVGPSGIWLQLLPLPNNPLLVGFELAAQAAFLPTTTGPIGIDVTGGLVMRLGR